MKNQRMMRIVPMCDQTDGPVTKAAKLALETGDPSSILIWIPEESENTLKNLLERTCCSRIIRKDAHDRTDEWYFEAVDRLHAACYGPRNLSISTKTPKEKAIILLVEGACESGDFKEIITVVPDTPSGEMLQRFRDLMKKRMYNCEDNYLAGRMYVSAFIDFITFVYTLYSGSFDNPDNLGH